MDLNLTNETKLKEASEAENEKLKETLKQLKQDHEQSLQANTDFEIKLNEMKRKEQKLENDLDGWKNEANIYHNKLFGTSKCVG